MQYAPTVFQGKRSLTDCRLGATQVKPNDTLYRLLRKAIAYGITVGARFLYNRRSRLQHQLERLPTASP
ncbi:MAG: hypothetical protein F6K47_34795 [Symploca sp. SIO2E6]|nr:hypothetical protein [Symploca sp. SIO2E6]